ncbi:hypothetical protein HOV43_gp212 [Escherichia phage vB_EcoM_KWBSE43-6]|uniref:Uncharacterized protein n=1 Tax=Escherichia phage vB_EcoM_KWBSE43-6 TaxID=2508194 RepID=A0A482MXW4_9CAUD|nr:hypothetical protein HOV43_gp212 [Escherichia phage vB_EcoM_KWBSE43-6]QBQ78971.1 hypothetical protein KWBSE43_00151 [Escherichia phage vB_EcoM_KWBSE43-6]
MIKAIKGDFTAVTSVGEISYQYATVQTFRGDATSVTVDVFLSDRWIIQRDGINVVDDTAPGFFKSVQFAPDWQSSLNIIDQAYEYLKSLPEFSNSTDVV